MRPARAARVLLALGALALAAAPAPAAARALTAAERRAVTAVDAATPEGLALLQRAVDQNSGTRNVEGVRAVAAMFEPPLRALGFDVRWVDGAAFERAGHLVARRAGRHPVARVLLVGHLDTVFDRDSPFQRLVVGPDSVANGPGVGDMKGGDVEMLLALRGLAAAGALDRLDVRVYLGGDEESSGSPHALSRAHLRELADGADVAIGFENGSGDPHRGLAARRGSLGWTLRVAGRAAHSSQIFRTAVGAGAVYEAARILDAFRDSLAAEPHLTLNAGLVLGGTRIAWTPGAARGETSGKPNVVPDSAVVIGDLRALTPAQFDAARACMERIVARHLPGTSAAIAFGDGYPPLAPARGNDRLLAQLDAASRDLGLGPVVPADPDDAGAADVAHVGMLVPAVIDGVGLPGGGGHSAEERGDLRALAPAARRIAVLLVRIAAGER